MPWIDRQGWDQRWRGGLYEAAPPLPEVRAFVAEHLAALGPADPILDLGCGNGRHLRALAGSALIVGSDWSHVALRTAATTLALEGKLARLVAAEHRALPFPGARFAAALAVQSVPAGTDLAELERVLRRDAPVFLRAAEGDVPDVSRFEVVSGPTPVAVPAIPPERGRVQFVDLVLRARPLRAVP